MPPSPTPVLDRLERPLKSLRLSVTDRCNLRCSYCMPEEGYTWLPRAELLDFDELGEVVDRFCELGVSRLRITGGEPLLRRDLPELVRTLADKPALKDVALTTNGLLLADQAQALRKAGLSRLTVSLDTLSKERFQAITRRTGIDKVHAGIEAARRAGFVGDAAGGARLKLDAVVLRGVNDDELIGLLDYAGQIGAELRFIEYMDVGGATQWSPEAVVSRAEMLERVATALGTVEPLAGRGSAPAERFRLSDGRVFGIVGSTTAPFCRACDRSRLTADGMWFHCLYAQHGLDLKTPLRAGSDPQAMRALLRSSWQARDDRGAEQRSEIPGRGALVPLSALRSNPHLEMHRRGG